MFDFTSPNYLYEEYGNIFILRDFLRDCKTDEEKEQAIKVFQKYSLRTFLIALILGLLVYAIVAIVNLF